MNRSRVLMWPWTGACSRPHRRPPTYRGLSLEPNRLKPKKKTMTRFSLLSILRLVALVALVPSVSNIQASAPRQVIIDEAALSSLPVDEQSRVLDLKCRLETLMATDKSTLGPDERRALRADYRAMKDEMSAINRDGTVLYLSTGAIIIIILLLILIL